MTPDKFEELKAHGAAVVKDVNDKIRKAGLKIEELKALQAQVRKEAEAVAAGKRANETAAKRIRCAQLRLFKMIDDNNLDQELKKLIEQEGEIRAGA